MEWPNTWAMSECLQVSSINFIGIGYVNDDFVAQNGRDAEKVYTLEKMRQEALIENNIDTFAEHSSR